MKRFPHWPHKPETVSSTLISATMFFIGLQSIENAKNRIEPGESIIFSEDKKIFTILIYAFICGCSSFSRILHYQCKGEGSIAPMSLYMVFIV